jgi:crossover junction endodeoxyribonuclease RusA
VVSPVVVEVVGVPAPQGSKRHVGRGVMVESSKRVKPWREAVKWAVLEQHGAGEPLDGALELVITFRLPRPASHYRSGANAHLLRDSAPRWPATRPDVDKLQRSTLDALGEAGVWRDDSQVVRVVATKAYADRDRPAGALITVVPL